MKEALYLVFHGFDNYNGISKKIHYQIKALNECGVNTHLCNYEIDANGRSVWVIDKVPIIDFGKSILAKIKRRINYKPILEYIIKYNIQIVYIRSAHNANPFLIHFIKQLKRRGIKVLMEIPTYPYDQEYISIRMKLYLLTDKCFRKQLAGILDGIITFSNVEKIFGKETIRISNGIDFSDIEQKQTVNNTSQQLNLIGVAEIHYWHGLDRVIHGLMKYYKSNPKYKVYFHIVGELSGEREKNEVLEPVLESNLQEYIKFYGNQEGAFLDELFNKSDMGIGSLARHRSGITHIKTLKNREYAARGIPFIYSEMDDDFDKMPYILKANPDETSINIHEIIQFYHKQKWSAKDIRNSVKHLSWKCQMQTVLIHLK